MFKCVNKADMTEQQITMKKKARPGRYPRQIDRYTDREKDRQIDKQIDKDRQIEGNALSEYGLI